MDLEKLKALCASATPGPWVHEDNDGGVWWGIDPEGCEIRVCGCGCLSRDKRERNTANADFIAAARTAVPELIARVEELETALDEACEFVDLCDDIIAGVGWGEPSESPTLTAYLRGKEEHNG